MVRSSSHVFPAQGPRVRMLMAMLCFLSFASTASALDEPQPTVKRYTYGSSAGGFIGAGVPPLRPLRQVTQDQKFLHGEGHGVIPRSLAEADDRSGRMGGDLATKGNDQPVAPARARDASFSQTCPDGADCKPSEREQGVPNPH